MTIRFGALLFGLVSMGSFLIDLIKLVGYNPKGPCHSAVQSANAFLMAIFSLLQVGIIFMFPRLNFISFPLVNRKVFFIFFVFAVTPNTNFAKIVCSTIGQNRLMYFGDFQPFLRYRIIFKRNSFLKKRTLLMKDI